MDSHYIKYIIKNLYWGLYGITISNPELPKHAKSILFICKGNICRSPFAERISQKYLNVSNEYKINSAGIIVEDSKHSPTETIIAAKYFNVDLQDHVSKQINYSMIESNDLIVTMETWQFIYLRKLFLEYNNKIFLLPLFDINNKKLFGNYFRYNIKDPFDKNLSEFEFCFKIIERCTRCLFDRLKHCKK